MCITKTEAWAYDGNTYLTEGRAIHAAIAKKLDNPAAAQKAMNNASDLIPLLQRVVEIEFEKNGATPDNGAKKDPPPPSDR